MDINKLNYFFRSAELQNFTKAAKECHIAQTTMSKYITVLEQEVGCLLFHRSHKTVRLTAQGERFYTDMKKIFREYQELCRDISRNQHKELRIGMISTDYSDFSILRSFEQSYPDISLYFSFASEEKLTNDLRQHHLDALICPNILNLDADRSDELVRINLVSIEESLVCSQELLQQYGSIEAVLENQPLITKTAETRYHNYCRETLLSLYGRTCCDVLIVSSWPQQLLMLNMSRGFAIIPTQQTVAYAGQLAVFPTSEAFYETAQLRYQPDYVGPSLQSLLTHIDEKKCC